MTEERVTIQDLSADGTRTPMITVPLLRRWFACYFREEDGEAKIARLFSGRESLTPREVTALDIPHADLMWVLTHALWDRDPWLCYDFALWCARQALGCVEPEWRQTIAAVVHRVTGLRTQPHA